MKHKGKVMLTVSLEVRPVGSRLSSGGARGQVLEPRGARSGELRLWLTFFLLQHTCDLAPRTKPPSSRDNFSNRSGTQ